MGVIFAFGATCFKNAAGNTSGSSNLRGFLGIETAIAINFGCSPLRHRACSFDSAKEFDPDPDFEVVSIIPGTASKGLCYSSLRFQIG